jgi:hypothetical protein
LPAANNSLVHPSLGAQQAVIPLQEAVAVEELLGAKDFRVYFCGRIPEGKNFGVTFCGKMAGGKNFFVNTS